MATSQSVAGTTGTWNNKLTNATSYSNYVSEDGFDLVWSQNYLQTQMESIQTNINDIEQNANLSDTEKMFSMQMAMNSWSAISNLRTNMLKSVSDTLKSIARNIS